MPHMKRNFALGLSLNSINILTFSNRGAKRAGKTGFSAVVASAPGIAECKVLVPT